MKAFYGTLPIYAFDLEKAKAELAQSSVPDGFDVTVPAPNADALHGQHPAERVART